jgi:uncharacterized protein (DUF697 family)
MRPPIIAHHRVNLVALYEKLERLVQRLPQPLQSPILKEITPIKTLFLQQRPPRLLLVGDRAASRTDLVNSLFSANVAEVTEDHVQTGQWQVFSQPGRGNLRILDARRPSGLAQVQRALAEHVPDAILFLETPPREDPAVEPDVKHAAEVSRFLKERHGASPIVFTVAIGNLLGTPASIIHEQLADRVQEVSGAGFEDRVAGPFVFSSGREEIHRFAAALAAELPPEARLEWARLSGEKEIQRELAQVVVKSVSAISGAVGAEPIPLADFPILMSLQSSMVAGIMYISGRELSVKRGGEWLAALGVNFGLGLVLREGARAAAKFVPGWGHVVSGGVAAAGTYAIGRTAIAYFIDGVSIEDARRLFRNRKSKATRLLDEKSKDRP